MERPYSLKLKQLEEKRADFAAAALQGLLTAYCGESIQVAQDSQELANTAVLMADRLIWELYQRRPIYEDDLQASYPSEQEDNSNP